MGLDSTLHIIRDFDSENSMISTTKNSNRSSFGKSPIERRL